MPALELFGRYGDKAQVALPIVAGLYALYRRDFAGVFMISAAGAINQIALFVIKKGVNARRPSGGGKSFPSGHTAAAFLAPAFLIHRFGWHQVRFLAPLCLLGAILTGASRIAVGAHWTQDVVAGAVLGWGVSFGLCALVPSLTSRIRAHRGGIWGQ